MKKIFLCSSLLLFAVSGFCQLVKPVKIDSLVTVSLPPGYQKKDTLGEQIFSANSMFGYYDSNQASQRKKQYTPKKRKRPKQSF
jgi:hypothetical protein